jgi:hypothetical protein
MIDSTCNPAQRSATAAAHGTLCWSCCLGLAVLAACSDATSPLSADAKISDAPLEMKNDKGALPLPDSQAAHDAKASPDSAKLDAAADLKVKPPTTSGIPLIFSVHLEAKTGRKCDVPGVLCATDAEFDDHMGWAETLVAAYKSRGLKGTFEMHLPWLTRLSESARGIAILKSITDGGHEIALHHHHFDHPDWDGYSDDPASAGQHSVYKNLKAQPMATHLAAVQSWESTFGYTIRTMASREFEFDWQAPWIFRTEDDLTPTKSTTLVDPSKTCAKASPKAQAVNLPARYEKQPHIKLGIDVHTIYHAWFIGDSPACQKTLASNVTAIAQALDPKTLDPKETVNLVHHLHNYGSDPAIMAEFNAFFDQIIKVPNLKPMTVREFICDRVKVCP